MLKKVNYPRCFWEGTWFMRVSCLLLGPSGISTIGTYWRAGYFGEGFHGTVEGNWLQMSRVKVGHLCKQVLSLVGSQGSGESYGLKQTTGNPAKVEGGKAGGMKSWRVSWKGSPGEEVNE